VIYAYETALKNGKITCSRFVFDPPPPIPST
jgi:hypothetical protein